MENTLAKSLWRECFSKRLHRYLPYTVEVVINSNTRTYLSLSPTRFSVHEAFLDAPEDVIKALAHYVMGKKNKMSKRLIRTYMQKKQSDLDYTDRVGDLKTKGSVYDLQKIYDELNLNYFEGQLNLKIGWFGIEKKKRKHMTFGLYNDAMKLIRIHKMMDSLTYPLYFVAFVVYHEMLHSVIPGYHDERGHFRIHGPEFKQREKEFHAYERARRWEKQNREKIFGWT